MEQLFRNKWFYIIGILATLAIIAWGLTSPALSSPAEDAEYEVLHEGWSQEVDGVLVPLDDIQNFYPVETGEQLIFSCTLPVIDTDHALLFYAEHQEVWCYVDGELIHSFTMQEGFTDLKTPGTAWVQVDLDPSMSEGSMVLVLSSEVLPFQNRLYDLFFVEDIDVDNVRIQAMWFHGIAILGLFILTIVAFINGIIWKNPQRKWFFLSLGELQLFVLMWALGEMNFFDLFTGRPIVSFLIAAVFVHLIPMALWRLTVNSTNRYEHPVLLKILCTLSLVNILLPWVLLFAFGISVLEIMWLHTLITSVVGGTLLVITAKKSFHFRDLKREEYPCLVVGLIIMGKVVDIIIVGLTPERTTLSSLWSVVGFGLYTIIIYFMLTVLDAETHTQKVAIEESYQKLQVNSLMRQIKAHFIFNTLNTISALCKVNPQEADRAILIFSTYLRAYMFLSNQQGSSTIEQELQLVEAYLTIEQMRFGDDLSFTLDTPFLAFSVPPLAVQNLVENAVNHGVRGQVNPGKVRITTRRAGDFAQVVVEDSGAGFDTSQPFKETSIGLRNVRTCVELLEGGDLTVESVVGKGTRATITIPLEKSDSMTPPP